MIRGIWAEHGDNVQTKLYLNYPGEGDEVRSTQERPKLIRSLKHFREETTNDWGGIGEEEARRRYFNEATGKWSAIPSGVKHVHHNQGHKELAHKNVRWEVTIFFC